MMKNVRLLLFMVGICFSTMIGSGVLLGQVMESLTKVSGYVVALDDSSPVAGATVNVAWVMTQTGPDGYFSLDLREVTELTDLMVTHPEFAPYSKPISGSVDDGATLEVLLKRVDTIVEIDPLMENTVETPDGVVVRFPPLKNVGEPLVIRLTSYNAGNRDLLAAPGNFTARMQDEDVQLISQGMVNIEAIGAETEQSYTLADEDPIVIDVPASGNPDFQSGQIPLWFYDRDTGRWIYIGESIQISEDTWQAILDEIGWDINIDKILEFFATIRAGLFDPDWQPNDTFIVRFLAEGWSVEYNLLSDYFEVPLVPVEIPIMISVTNQRTGMYCEREIIIPQAEAGQTIELPPFCQ